MATSIRSLFFGVAGLALAASVAPAAWAGCGEGLVKTPATWQSTGQDQADALLNRISLPATASPSLVGMWSVRFSVGTALIDFGYGQFHSDGTEFFNSGGRAPATQNYCLGVWTQTGSLAYQVNHYALSYDSTGVLNGKVNIKEAITLASGNERFTGTFTIDVYDLKTNAVLQHVAGTLAGVRIGVNSPPP